MMMMVVMMMMTVVVVMVVNVVVMMVQSTIEAVPSRIRLSYYSVKHSNESSCS